eukprot:scaffold6_cov330-Pavlova_lutheri.AAC.10
MQPYVSFVEDCPGIPPGLFFHSTSPGGRRRRPLEGSTRGDTRWPTVVWGGRGMDYNSTREERRPSKGRGSSTRECWWCAWHEEARLVVVESEERPYTWVRGWVQRT